MYMVNLKEMIKMNGEEFIKAVDGISKEKGIDKEVVFEAMELALATAYKKNFNSLTNILEILKYIVIKQLYQMNLL